MCSIDEEKDNGVTDLARPPRVKVQQLCLKCPSQSTVLLRGRDGYCRVCFDKTYIHKFRAQLGKTHILAYEEKVTLSPSPRVTDMFCIIKI